MESKKLSKCCGALPITTRVVYKPEETFGYKCSKCGEPFIPQEKPIKKIINEYVEKKDLLGLAEYFKAYIEDEIMENITQCKECGHENPKKFMGEEYTSHAPNCSQETKQQNTNKLEQIIEDLAMAITHSEQGVYSVNEKFVREKISLVVEQEKERIKEKIDKLPRYGTSQHTIPPNFWAYKCEDVEGVISNQQ